MKAFWPEKLSQYTDRQLLGAGQYGLVYKVHNSELNRTTVIKLIEVSLGIDPMAVKRFNREIKALERIQSPHVISLLKYWIEPDFLAFESDYVKGLSLEQLIKKLNKIPYSAKKDIIQNLIFQIASGLTAIHRQDLVHRDLKPSNILIQLEDVAAEDPPQEVLRKMHESGFTVRLTDLGVVKQLSATVSITRTNDIIGTAAYIAPEQAVGDKISPFADMYSLGLLWYELISGDNPFYKTNIYATIQAHLHEEAPNIQQFVPEVPLDIAHILSLLLQKNPEDRFYQSELLLRTLKQRQSTTESEQFDISLLLPTSSPKAEECPAYQKFVATVRQVNQLPAVILICHSSQTVIQHIAYHSSLQEEPFPYRQIVHTPDLHQSALFSFLRGIIDEFDELEIEEYSKNLDDNSFEAKYFHFFRLNNFFQQCDFSRKNFKRIPFQIKAYNVVVLARNMLAFLARKKPLILLLNNAQSLQEALPGFLPLLMSHTKNTPVYWALAVPEGEETKIRELIPEFLDVTEFIPEAPCTNPINCPFGQIDFPGDVFSPPDASSPLPLSNENSEWRAVALEVPEQEFINYFTLSGFLNPLAFVNWLLREKFNRDSGIVLSLLNKKVLFQCSGILADHFLALTSAEYYHQTLSHIPARKRQVMLQEITEFWESQTDYDARERLLQYYRKLGTFSQAVQIALELMDFYESIMDRRENERLIQIIQDITLHYKLPTLNRLKFYSHHLVSLTLNRQHEEVLRFFEEQLDHISDKYKAEKMALTILGGYNAVFAGQFEKAGQFAKQLEEMAGEPMTASLLLNTFYHLNTGNLKEARQAISETLMLWNKSGHYWNIPTGSLILAIILTRAGDAENAYQYATLGFQTARTLHDYWVMQQVIPLIESNPYYRENHDTLIDWREMGERKIPCTDDLLNAFDPRSEWLAFIH